MAEIAERKGGVDRFVPFLIPVRQVKQFGTWDQVSPSGAIVFFLLSSSLCTAMKSGSGSFLRDMIDLQFSRDPGFHSLLLDALASSRLLLIVDGIDEVVRSHQRSWED